MEIFTFLACFETLATGTAGRQLALMAQARLSMTGRITMLWLSRWTDKGGSYRTINRFLPPDWLGRNYSVYQNCATTMQKPLLRAGFSTAAVADKQIVREASAEVSEVDELYSFAQDKQERGQFAPLHRRRRASCQEAANMVVTLDLIQE